MNKPKYISLHNNNFLWKSAGIWTEKLNVFCCRFYQIFIFSEFIMILIFNYKFKCFVFNTFKYKHYSSKNAVILWNLYASESKQIFIINKKTIFFSYSYTFCIFKNIQISSKKQDKMYFNAPLINSINYSIKLILSFVVYMGLPLFKGW